MYRFFVKRNYANMKRIGFICIVKNIYFFTVLLIALVIGIMGAVGSSSRKRFSEPSDDDLSYEYLWLIAVIIGNCCLLSSVNNNITYILFDWTL